jgi:hypothetical protein
MFLLLQEAGRIGNADILRYFQALRPKRFRLWPGAASGPRTALLPA